MNKQSTKTGRTFFDLIVDYPKISIPLIVFVALLLAYFVLFKLSNFSYSNGKLEINAPKPDTIVVPQRIYVNQVDTIYMPEAKSSPNNLHAKSISNTNSGNIKNQYIISENKGIIGDNTTINLNSPEVQRHLDSEGIQQMTEIIKRVIVENSLTNNPPIYIRATFDSEESINFAQEIFNYLKRNNYNVISNEFEIFTPPINQTRVIAKADGSIHIQVGYNK